MNEVDSMTLDELNSAIARLRTLGGKMTSEHALRLETMERARRMIVKSQRRRFW